jgi:hypothetical protein
MRTDGHDEANSRSSKLCERVYKRISVTGRSGNMNSAAIIFLAVTATKICINPRYLQVSSTGSGMLFKVQTKQQPFTFC